MQERLREKVAVVGGGIAGTLTSELLWRKGYQVTLFEKSDRLGGCSGSFVRNGFTFNTGATTIAGLNDGFPVSEILSNFKIENNIKIVDPSIIIHTPRGIVRRFSCLSDTVDEIDRVFPHRGNYDFWKKVYDMTYSVLTHSYYHNFSSWRNSVKSLLNMKSLILKHFKSFLIPAEKGLREFFPQIERDYYDFMDAHVKIVSQSSIAEVNFLTMLLSLGYPFTGVGYPREGMGKIFEEIVKNTNCLLNSEVKSIKRKNSGFILKGDFGEEEFKKVVISMPVFENLNIMEDDNIRDYIKRYLKLNSDNSAIVLYGVIKNFSPDYNFHLRIIREPLPYTSSRYLFFSFNEVKKENSQYTTFTVSTHTRVSYWINTERHLYDIKKEKLREMILNIMKDTFGLKTEQVVQSFMATPETFFRYLGRRSVGGIPVTRKAPFWRIPSNFSPFENLYFAGDSFFCYQGWIGVSMGVRNILENLDEKV